MAAKEGVPPKEVTEVIILNRDFLVSDEEVASGARVKDPTSIAARLVELHRKRPSVWTAAQRDGYVLKFDKLAPGQSQRILEKFPDLGAASLIVTQYEDVATQAASIVDHYGELGVTVLAHYDGSENFRKLLRNANIAHRIAMVAVLRSDVGLESALSNPAYVDKWVGSDGKPLADEWWVNVPFVGGIANVAKNYGTGVPSDWSEIGWAAWDVADIALMVVTLGGSKVGIEVGKQVAKQTAKQVGKKASQKLTSAGLKFLPNVSKPTAMARLLAVAKTSKAAAPIRWTSGRFIQVTRSAISFGGKLVSVSNKVIKTAKSIPPGVRVWAARGLLGASLIVRGPDRIRALIASLNNYAKEVVADAIAVIPHAIGDAIEKIKKDLLDAARGNLATILYFSMTAFFAVLALLLLLDIGPRLSFASQTNGAASKGRKSKTSTKQ